MRRLVHDEEDRCSAVWRPDLSTVFVLIENRRRSTITPTVCGSESHAHTPRRPKTSALDLPRAIRCWRSGRRPMPRNCDRLGPRSALRARSAVSSQQPWSILAPVLRQPCTGQRSTAKHQTPVCMPLRRRVRTESGTRRQMRSGLQAFPIRGTRTPPRRTRPTRETARLHLAVGDVRSQSRVSGKPAVRSMKWVGDFSRLESTTWRWWPRFVPDGTGWRLGSGKRSAFRRRRRFEAHFSGVYMDRRRHGLEGRNATRSSE
jgi:hypothetical protein